MDNFDNNNMGGFEPQKPFTEKPVQNNNMNTEQTIPVSEPKTQEEQAQNVQPQNGNTPYGDYIFGNNNQNTANNANPTEKCSAVSAESKSESEHLRSAVAVRLRSVSLQRTESAV